MHIGKKTQKQITHTIKTWNAARGFNTLAGQYRLAIFLFQELAVMPKCVVYCHCCSAYALMYMLVEFHTAVTGNYQVWSS